MKPGHRICSKLVVDSTFSNALFDENGISSQYHDFFENVLPNWHYKNSKDPLLEKTIEEIKKSRNGDFDCIIGMSGGADSSYMLHLMVTEYDLNPLVFHVDGGWNTETSVSNINNIVDKLGLDLFTEVINWEEMKDFQLAMFKSGVPHIDIPQDMAFIGVLYKFAEENNIKWILNGGNISTECVQVPTDILYYGTDLRQVNSIIKKYGTKPMPTYPFSSIFYHKLWLPYFKGVKVFKPLNYVEYNKESAMDLMKKQYGFKKYPQKHFESRFTRFFEGYWLPKRFNFDMRKVQFSSLILTGQMSRDTAITELKEPALEEDFAQKEFAYVASKLDISEDELNSYLNSELKFYSDYPNNKNIFDLGEKVLMKIAGTRRGGAF